MLQMSMTKALLTAVNNYICKFYLTSIELPIFDHLSAIKLIDYNFYTSQYQSITIIMSITIQLNSCKYHYYV